jgi:hypothetical protein
MATQYRFILLSLLILLVAACAPNENPLALEVEAISDQAVVRTIQYVDGQEVGPLYNFSLTVPQDWVGEFETRKEGNTVAFAYTGAGERSSPVFFVEALSNSQYWEQIGSYPGQFTNIVYTSDTYFIYYMPIDPYYSGLERAEFERLAEPVPEIIQTFTAEPVVESPLR